MLTKLRSKVARLLTSVSRPLAIAPAWVYTLLALILSLLFLVACSIGLVLIALTLLILSSLLDAIDGCVARIRGEASPRGALLDSVTDRVIDLVYGLGLLTLGFSPLIVYLWTTLSIVISYIRSRYESLRPGSTLEGVGLMERGDRVIAIVIVLTLLLFIGKNMATLALTIACVLAGITVVERFIQAYRRL